MDKETVALAERAIKALADIAEKHGPAALDLALAATRWEAGLRIAACVAGVAVAAAIAKTAIHYARAAYKAGEKNDWRDDGPVFGTLISGGVCAVSAIVGVVFIANSLAPALWLAVIDPRMALAARVLGLGK